MELEEYTKIYTKDDAPGWIAIDQEFKKLYPRQEPKHWAATPHYSLGGEDPLDGISYYEAEYNGETYYHFITYGFSDLYYDEEHIDNEYSRLGFELTFRLKPFHLDDKGPAWVYGLIQNIARYVFNSGNWFEPNQHMPANGQIRLNCDTKITGLAFSLDPELGKIMTPHGEVQFIQMFGITDEELEKIKNSSNKTEELLNAHSKKNPLLITDLMRDLQKKSSFRTLVSKILRK